MNEFDFIAKKLRALTNKHPAARKLLDDAAVYTPTEGHEMVMTTDTLTEGVHFPIGDNGDAVAYKAVAVNMSDLAAMGATPVGYLLAGALPHDVSDGWVKHFLHGLKTAKDTLHVPLWGGDTVRHDAGVTLTVTAIGEVPKGQALSRSNAREGDHIYVTGTIGDAALGLTIENTHLLNRLRFPEPRINVGEGLRGLATSCIDVSDGLLADLGHICECSKMSADIECELVPLSEEAKAHLNWETVLTGGDDYELCFTAPESVYPQLEALSKTAQVPITKIGHIRTGETCVNVYNGKGERMEITSKGYTHF